MTSAETILVIGGLAATAAVLLRSGSTDIAQSAKASLGIGSDGVTGANGMTADLEIFARTLYGEARGVSDLALESVACVIRNRYHLGPLGGFGVGWAGVCKQPYQFSCWNTPDMKGTTANMTKNRAAMLAVKPGDSHFDRCIKVASETMAGQGQDWTGGALYYHDSSISEPASWQSKGYRLTIVIEPFSFYKGALL